MNGGRAEARPPQDRTMTAARKPSITKAPPGGGAGETTGGGPGSGGGGRPPRGPVGGG